MLPKTLPDLNILKFNGAGDDLFMLWLERGSNPYEIHFPRVPSAVVDFLGNPVAWTNLSGGGVSIPVGDSLTYAVFPSSAASADPTAGLRDVYVFPNPAVGKDPVIRAKLGLVDRVEITIYDSSGQVVHSAALDGAVATVVNGEYCYDYVWTGKKASGIYYAVIHGKKGGEVVRARVKFAVVR
jgi:hypothetical protein